MGTSGQTSLFDNHLLVDQVQVTAARAQMRAMIDRLAGATFPHWTDTIGAILDDGCFRRAMWLVSAEEGAALWAEYDAHMERLYAVWAATQPAPEE